MQISPHPLACDRFGLLAPALSRVWKQKHLVTASYTLVALDDSGVGAMLEDRVKEREACSG